MATTILKTIIKVIQEEARTSLKINLDDEKNSICIYNSEILKFIANIIFNYNVERTSYPGAAKTVSNLYKQVKKTIKRIDEIFVFNFAFQGQVFELDNSYYTKFLETAKILYDGTYESQTPKYETLCDPLNKLCIIVMNYLERLQKEELSKGIN